VRTLGAVLDDDGAVDLHFARIGSVTAAGSAGGTVIGTHLGQLDVRLTRDGEVPSAAIEQRILERMRAALPIADARLVLGRPTLIAFGPPIEIQVFSEDVARGAEMARTLAPRPARARVAARGRRRRSRTGRPEVRVRFDRERLGRVGLSVSVAAAAVQRAIAGEVATQLHLPDKQLDVRVRLPIADRGSVEDVAAISVGMVGGIPVRLAAVADVEPDRGPAEIRRINGRRGLRIRARTDGVNLGGVAPRSAGSSTPTPIRAAGSARRSRARPARWRARSTASPSPRRSRCSWSTW
jgi:multidrug efflux pump subunit AcrB